MWWLRNNSAVLAEAGHCEPVFRLRKWGSYETQTPPPTLKCFTGGVWWLSGGDSQLKKQTAPLMTNCEELASLSQETSLGPLLIPSILIRCEWRVSGAPSSCDSFIWIDRLEIKLDSRDEKDITANARLSLRWTRSRFLLSVPPPFQLCTFFINLACQMECFTNLLCLFHMSICSLWAFQQKLHQNRSPVFLHDHFSLLVTVWGSY